GAGADDQGAGGVAERLAARALLDQPDGLGRERGEVCEGAAEPGAEDLPRRLREGVVEGEPGEQPEGERTRRVDDERAPREGAAGAVADVAVDDVPEGGTDGGGGQEPDPGQGAHSASGPRSASPMKMVRRFWCPSSF